MEGQGMIRTLSPYLEQGRIRIFCINSVNSDSFQNKGAHPFHRSWMQAQYDDYVASEVFPFIDSQCQRPGIGIATLGASLGAYHAANTLFKHPDHVKRCYALSGVYAPDVGVRRTALLKNRSATLNFLSRSSLSLVTALITMRQC
jgi:esterase/lipase superfamily enzyme